MGLFTPKPYKRFNRQTGTWETVTPTPEEYNQKSTLPSLRVGSGGNHKHFPLVLIEKFAK